MSLAASELVIMPVRFPRVSGDEPDSTVRKWQQRGFSPRERG